MSQSSKSSDKSPIWAKIIVAVGWAIVIGAPLVWWFHFKREHRQWSEEIRLWDWNTLQIERHSSNKAYHGIVGHFSPFWWGGGDPWAEVDFTIRGKAYHWEGRYIPIAIQPDEGRTAVYIVAFDRESDEAAHNLGYTFRIYRRGDANSWNAIEPKDFPKHLAIQNTWLNRHNGNLNEYDIVTRMDPADPWFRRSLTGALWAFLEDPNDRTGKNREPDENAIKEYKTKWIRPRPAYRPDGAPW